MHATALYLQPIDNSLSCNKEKQVCKRAHQYLSVFQYTDSVILLAVLAVLNSHKTHFLFAPLSAYAEIQIYIKFKILNKNQHSTSNISKIYDIKLNSTSGP